MRVGWGWRPARWTIVALAIVAMVGLSSFRAATVATTAGEVTVAIAPNAAVVPSGGEVTYAIVVANGNPTELTNLRVTDALPNDFRYVPGSTAVNGLTAADPLHGEQTLTWSGLRAPAGNNVYGMHTFVQDVIADPASRQRQLDWSLALAGRRGYVTQLFYPIMQSSTGALPAWKAFVAEAYRRRLIPVIRLGGTYNQATRTWDRPAADANGNYTQTAAAFARVVNDLPLDSELPLYVEVWNEPNLNVEWGGAANAAQYGRFLRDVAAAIHALRKPQVKVMNAALAPGGDIFHLDFIDAMLRGVPAVKDAIDVWASHPTSGNHPPAYDADYYSIRGYEWELARLFPYYQGSAADRARFAGLRVIATEAGYQLGNAEDPRCPPIDEQNRAAYTREAYGRYWSQDPRVLGVTPFELSDPAGIWARFDWVYPGSGTNPDGSPTRPHPAYGAVKTLLKPYRGLLVITFRARAALREGQTYYSSASASAAGATIQPTGLTAPVRICATGTCGTPAATATPGPPAPSATPAPPSPRPEGTRTPTRPAPSPTARPEGTRTPTPGIPKPGPFDGAAAVSTAGAEARFAAVSNALVANRRTAHYPAGSAGGVEAQSADPAVVSPTATPTAVPVPASCPTSSRTTPRVLGRPPPVTVLLPTVRN